MKMSKILVIDDNEDMCQVISDALKEEGFLVNTAYNGKSAIKEIKDNIYDFIILDYKLHDMDGLEILGEIRKFSSLSSVIMISAYGNEFIRSKAYGLGICSFFDKPFDLNALVGAVKQNLKG